MLDWIKDFFVPEIDVMLTEQERIAEEMALLRKRQDGVAERLRALQAHAEVIGRKYEEDEK